MRRSTIATLSLLVYTATAWPQNLLPNSSFEELDGGTAKGWRLSGKAALVADRAIAHSG